MNYFNRKILFLFIIILVNGCKTPVQVLPPGNEKQLNTQTNDVAPTQQINIMKSCDPCEQEFNMAADAFSNVKQSDVFLRQIIGYKLAANAESIAFISDTNGIFSISHPPDSAASQALGVNLSGVVGGTDLFEFYKLKDTFRFKNLEKLNSVVWDSHPTVIMNEKCDLLIIFSSDRFDSTGFSRPYSVLYKLDNENTYQGNADLYYAFRINGLWTEPKNLNLAGGNINTKYNEETPYLYCSCLKPILLFSSDRNGDFDIYAVKLGIDYENQKITATDTTFMLPKGDININSRARDFFPYVSKPLSTNPNENFIYLSSDRFRDVVKVNEDTLMKNVGNYDIYKFYLPASVACTPPKITLRVHVLDAELPNVEIKQPFTKVSDVDNPALSQIRNENHSEFNVFSGHSYIVGGGSTYDKISCESGLTRTLSNYTYRKITRYPPDTIRKDTTIYLEEVVRRKGKIRYDTLRKEMNVKSTELSKVETGPNRKIEGITVKGDSLVISMIEFKEINASDEFDTIVHKNIVPVEYVINKTDTAFIPITQFNPALSQKTIRERFVGIPKTKEDRIIDDTVYVWSQYYYYPPCEWKYVQHDLDYRRNVPYFQTGFWEVNTTENLPEQMSELRSKKFADASFIELHTKNSYFGYHRGDLTPEKEKSKKAKYDNRLAEYKKFAVQVDKNLNEMADEIGGFIFPAFTRLDTQSAGNQNKLIIVIYGYSDIRAIQKGSYIGDSAIDFASVVYDTLNNNIRQVNMVDIPPGTSLVGENNDILSKLRTFFGYREIIKKLEKYPEYQYYLSKGEVLMPENVRNKADFESKFRNSKIVFVLEGKQIDPTQFKIPGYVGEEGDYRSLDPIRRINVVIKRVEVVGGTIKKPDCCQPAPEKLIRDKE